MWGSYKLISEFRFLGASTVGLPTLAKENTLDKTMSLLIDIYKVEREKYENLYLYLTLERRSADCFI